MRHKRSIIVMAVLSAASFAPTTYASTIWLTGVNDVSFSKAAFADPTLPANQDMITSLVALTRGSTSGLYNADDESFFTHGLSPQDTEWAFSGLDGNETFNYDTGLTMINNLTFSTWETALGGTGALQDNITTNHPGVLHLITDDIYLAINFTNWGGSASGGAFAYTRSGPPLPSTLAKWDGSIGTWITAAKWSTNPVFPNNNSSSLYDVEIDAGQVTLNVDVSINKLTVNGGTLTGSNNLTLNSGVINGTYDLSGQTTVTSGVLEFGPGVHSANLITGNGSVTVDAGAELDSEGIQVNQLTINGFDAIAASSNNSGTTKVNLLTIAHSGSTYSGKFDITNAALIEEASDPTDKTNKISDLNAAITSGSNSATWTGNGLTSATAAGDPAHLGIGVFDNAILGKTSFGGQSVDSNSILTAVTHLGDANRDGVVDLQDLSIVTNHWQTNQNNWAAGDLNRDGVVDLGDLSLVTNNWQQTSSFHETALSIASPGVAAVPEPASALALAGGAMLLAMKYRRRRAASK